MVKREYTSDALWDTFGKKYPVKRLENLFFKDTKFKDFEKFEEYLFNEFKKTYNIQKEMARINKCNDNLTSGEEGLILECIKIMKNKNQKKKSQMLIDYLEGIEE